MRCRAVTAAAVMAGAGVLAGCSGNTPSAAPSAASSASSPSGTPTATSDPEAQQLLSRAKDALAGADSVHVKGSSPQANGGSVDIDLSVRAGQGGKGTIGTPAMPLQLLVVGTQVYIYGSKDLVTKQGLPTGASGKWLLFPATQVATFQAFGDPRKLADAILSPRGALTKGETKVVGGKPAVALVDNPQGGRLWIATEGDPLPLRIESGKGGGGIDFTYGEAIEVTAPPAGSVLDLSALAAPNGSASPS